MVKISIIVLLLNCLFANSLYSESTLDRDECLNFNQSECSNNSSCEWVESFSYGNCSSLTVNQCYSYPGECYVDPGMPGWYPSSGPPHCDGGTYQIDNSYCQEIEMLNCSDISHPGACSEHGNCSWVEDVQYESCAMFTSSSECWAMDGCYWYSGTYYPVFQGCNGQFETSYYSCIENEYLNGDINLDLTINIQDVILIVNIILEENAYQSLADMNSDNIINILDVIQIVSLILTK